MLDQMLYQQTVVIALRSLRINMLRTSLTMLGLVIGVAAVIVLSASGRGVGDSVYDAISSYANNIYVVPVQPEVPGAHPARPLTDADAAALRGASDLALITPQVTGATTNGAGTVSTAVVVTTPSSQFLSGSVVGTAANWFETNSRQLQAGTTFSPRQDAEGARVCVIGPNIAAGLFGAPAAAVGKRLTIRGSQFTVIGVMLPYGLAGGVDADNDIVMPLRVSRSAIFGFGYGGNEINEVTATATSEQAAGTAATQIRQIMEQRHHITNPVDDDFEVVTLGSRLDTFNAMINLLDNFTPIVAAISLLVGGIGVLNIMLVSVTDRTQEIGTRKALGATDEAILGQFVFEAVTIAGIGGLIGIGAGVGLICAVRLAVPLLDRAGGVLAHFYPVISSGPIVLAFSISLFIGVLAGGWPAWRASRLDPIEALRHE